MDEEKKKHAEAVVDDVIDQEKYQQINVGPTEEVSPKKICE
jgi:hypothetical protein